MRSFKGNFTNHNLTVLVQAVFVVLCLFCNLQQINCMTCLECADVPNARDCDTVKECGPHEVCFSTQLVSTSGHIYRKMGCRDKMQCSSGIVHKRNKDDLPVCDGCCDSLWCQARLCQDQVYVTGRGPICYSCEKQLEDENCTKIEECSRDEVCVESFSRSAQGHLLRKTSCFSKLACDRIYGSNSFHRTPETCFNCCQGDLCNTRCDMMPATTKPPSVVVTQPAQNSTQAGCSDSTPEATCKLAASIVCTDQIHAQNANCHSTQTFLLTKTVKPISTVTYPISTTTSLTVSSKSRTSEHNIITGEVTDNRSKSDSGYFFLSTLPTLQTTYIRGGKVLAIFGCDMVKYLRFGITRVVRGRDWKWYNQDSNDPGTVLRWNTENPLWVDVKWDNGVQNFYRMGAEGKFDLYIVSV